MKKIISVFCLVMCVICTWNSVLANNVDSMLKGEQDLVVLGSVKDIKNGIVTVTVDHVLGKTVSDMIGTDISVSQFVYSYCEDHSTGEFRSPKVSDNIVISLNSSEEGYELANSAYKVDSNEYASCKIIVHEDIHEEECIKSLLEATCYIRANAKVKEFEFDEEGRIYAVYPQTAEQCVHIVGDDGTSVVTQDIPDTLPTVPPAAPEEAPVTKADNRWIVSLVILGAGIVLGTLGAYMFFLKKSR